MKIFDSLLWAHSTPGNHNLNKLESTIPEDGTMQVIAFWSGLKKKRFFKHVFSINIFLCKNSTTHCGPNLPQGSLFLLKFTIHFLGMLSHKSQLVWPKGGLSSIFFKIPTNFNN